MKTSKPTYNQVQIRNKRAKFEYQLQDRFVAGLVLTGTEIKSIRLGKANLQDAYGVFEADELWVHGMHISPYEQGSHYNHEPLRKRKLLLNKTELRKLKKIVKDVGVTIIPLKLFINSKGLAKLEIATGRGKKLYDKRQDLQRKDQKREIRRSGY